LELDSLKLRQSPFLATAIVAEIGDKLSQFGDYRPSRPVWTSLSPKTRQKNGDSLAHTGDYSLRSRKRRL